MKKIIYILSSLFCFSISQSIAQDTLVVMKAGQAVYKRAVTDVDSIIFKPSTTVVDISGNVYPIVTIGTQTWLGENLRVEKYNDGTAIPLVTDNAVWTSNYTNSTKLPMMAWYNNDKVTHSANKNGVLYNWYVVDSKKLCPIGWHVPSDTEWTTLDAYLGTEAGTKLKSTSGWNVINTSGLNGTNEIKFTAIPGGYRNYFNGAFSDLGGYGQWWSASASGTKNAWYRFISSKYGSLNRMFDHQGNGMSVRCLKD